MEDIKLLHTNVQPYKLVNTPQEFEELFGNVPFEDIEKIKKYLLENYIPKSKIKESIKELEKWLEGGKYTNYGMDGYLLKAQKEILQELMEDK